MLKIGNMQPRSFWRRILKILLFIVSLSVWSVFTFNNQSKHIESFVCVRLRSCSHRNELCLWMQCLQPTILFAGSKRNYSTLTLDGVDVMGGRLAEEVCAIIIKTKFVFLCCYLDFIYFSYVNPWIYFLFRFCLLSNDIQMSKRSPSYAIH